MSFQPIKDPHNSRTYRDEAIELALGYCPKIYPCQHCNHPVIDGFCCPTCGSENPGSAERADVEVY